MASGALSLQFCALTTGSAFASNQIQEIQKWTSKEDRDQGSEWACPVFSDSEEGIISGLFGFKVSWGLVVKTGVESGAVVEGFDVMEDGATRFG
jgi:hypothetical protein